MPMLMQPRHAQAVRKLRYPLTDFRYCLRVHVSVSAPATLGSQALRVAVLGPYGNESVI